MPSLMIRQILRRIFRIASLKWKMLTFIVISSLLLTFMMQVSSRPKRLNSLFHNENSLLENVSKQTLKVQSARKEPTNDAKCRLPVLDPWHSSISKFVRKIPKVDCGSSFSSFENNTLIVKGHEIVSATYRIIGRPSGSDFSRTLSGPYMVKNTKVLAQTTLQEGAKGCLIHTSSQKCLHPYGGGSDPKIGDALVFHSDCCFKRIGFTLKNDQSILHIQSSLCLNVKDGKVILDRNCSTKFQVMNGTIYLSNNETFCIESSQLNGLPAENEPVVVGKSCSQSFGIIPNNDKGKDFVGLAQVNSDFIRVDIKLANNKPDVTEVHMQTAPKPEVQSKKGKPVGIPVNIAMIMFDSTSSANFIRHMEKTNKYLKTRPTVYMKGNTIVGDGTTAQLCAMLTGIAEKNQPEARRSKPNSTSVDDWRWVFRDYHNNGYATLFNEDSPSVASFNYRLHGFKNPPTDHFGRYFWFEADNFRKNGICDGNEAVHRLSYKYMKSFFRTYNKQHKFSLTVHSDLTHNDINGIQRADEDLTNLLKTFEREGFLEDTILMIFGDHGIRFGSVREALQGKLEERLPHLSITFPPWFPKRYPDLYNAVHHNSKILTTPFDTYATLKHVLSYPNLPKDIHVGQSLFQPINASERACSNVGVEDHWCPCMNYESVPLNETILQSLAGFSVRYINKQIEKEGQNIQALCKNLTLKEIRTAVREMPNTKVQQFQKSSPNDVCDSCGIVLGKKDKNTLIQDTVYQLQFVTSPNNGVYEASIRVQNGIPNITGTISRINAYGHQPDCVKDRPHLLKYCYCKSQH